MNLQLGDVSHIIQLAIAPVFLLTGVGTKLSVLTSRLARIIDRSRVVEEQLIAADGSPVCVGLQEELNELYERARLINRAIALSTSCGLLICLVIASLFMGDAISINLDKFIAALFVGGIFSLIGSFIYFMREIFVATKTLSRQHKLGKSKIIAR
ncbi:MAG: DUF2721 domain-containing protein [Burkholderiales bacterium]|nr:DUF2721 domain-containing protein [Burkholderiales bacterium]